MNISKYFKNQKSPEANIQGFFGAALLQICV